VLRRAGLTLDEAARDLARGVHPLLEVDGEREEVEAGARLRAVGGPEDHGVAVANGDRAAGEACELAGLDGQRAAADLRLESLRQGDLSSWCVEEVTTCGQASRLRFDGAWC
jgi:hypothetical protein